ncbi:MAG: Small heat shock protein HSP16.5 [Candidatus Bathyarchaeota archaeon BA1]|nr:MAG: Small heat shock protein HSP16.5 [Candidatus Bathyarchaeota archaeon BA1]
MSVDWWWRRRKRRPESDPWVDIFDEFGRLEEMMRRAFEIPIGETRTYRPFVYGFSMSVGPDGKPVIREFGNVERSRAGPQIREEREPLVDIMEEEKDVVVVAELPGVEKEDIYLNATEEQLTISVDTPQRKYRKELTLPARVDPKSAMASYKNGVLEVRLRKLTASVRGERLFLR